MEKGRFEKELFGDRGDENGVLSIIEAQKLWVEGENRCDRCERYIRDLLKKFEESK